MHIFDGEVTNSASIFPLNDIQCSYRCIIECARFEGTFEGIHASNSKSNIQFYYIRKFMQVKM